MLERFAELRAAEDLQVIESECFERTKPRPLPGGRYLFLSGKIDRLSRRPDGITEVMDFKTGADLPSASELADDPATTIYYLLAERRCPHTRIVVVQMSLRSGARSEIELTPSEVDTGKAHIREMVRQVAENDFSRTRSGACAYCPACNGCAALDSHEDDEELEAAW